MKSLYFVAIEPQQELIEKIKEIQKDFAVRFNSVKSFHHFPHITLVPPFHFEDEQTLMSSFFTSALPKLSFSLRLENFGTFHHSKSPTIFIQILENSILTEVFNAFQHTSPFHSPYPFRPHLTVAFRDLDFENHQKAWSEYQFTKFNAIFKVRSIRLYKHVDKKWQMLAERTLD